MNLIKAALLTTFFIFTLNDTCANNLVRRTYIDLAGRTPSAEEISKAKIQSQVVAEILQSDWYVNNMFNLWADWLRLSDRRDSRAIEQYKEWLLNSIKQNKTYDAMVKELVGAEGHIGSNGAIGFYVRDKNNALDHASFIADTFLGQEVNCAQCHNHPFKDFTQLEFYELAAYTYNVRTSSNPQNKRDAKNLVKGLDDEDKLNRLIDDMFRNIDFSVTETKNKLSLPHDYQYKNAKPKQRIEPNRILGISPPENLDKNRDLYVKWMTSPKNKFFVRNVVERLWHRFIGEKEMTPQQLSKWCNKMVQYNFDLKKYLNDFLCSIEYTQNKTVRRMTAEQIWDSFVYMYNPEYTFNETSQDNDVKKYYEFLQTSTPQQITNIVTKVSAKVEKPSMRDIYEEVTGQKYRNKKRNGGYFVASSDQRTPANDGHFLRQFGQSNRQVLNNSNQDPSVQQALTLMNGDILRILFDNKSHFKKGVDTNNDKNFIFLSFYGKKPSPEESRVFTNFSSQEIAWVLMNSKRFIFYE